MDNKIYTTSNYKMFKTLDANREEIKNRANRLRKSLVNMGQLMPIVVNRRGEVVDGQARLMALQSLGMPVQYIVRDYAVNECIEMNNSQTAWRSQDYIKSFSKQGSVSFGYLNSLFTEFSDLLATIIFIAASGSYINTAGNLGIKSGKFEMDAISYSRAREELNFVRMMTPYIKHLPGKIHYYQTAFIFCYRTPEVNNERLASQVRKHCAELLPAANVEIATAQLEKIYNKNARGKVYINTLYRERSATVRNLSRKVAM